MICNAPGSHGMLECESPNRSKKGIGAKQHKGSIRSLHENCREDGEIWEIETTAERFGGHSHFNPVVPDQRLMCSAVECQHWSRYPGACTSNPSWLISGFHPASKLLLAFLAWPFLQKWGFKITSLNAWTRRQDLWSQRRCFSTDVESVQILEQNKVKTWAVPGRGRNGRTKQS